jgi:tetratricopeptide (TPR) repeat protein
MISLAGLQDLYDRNRFLEAFRQSAEYWKPSQRLDELSSEELILGGRLAVRLGGRRLSRRLFRAAWARNPSDPKVRYFTQGVRRRAWKLFDQLRNWEVQQELEGADANTQASWLASQAVIWASLRDFPRARACIDRAKSFATRESWVFSCESDVSGLEDRWDEALKSAEVSWEMNPGTPYAAHSLGNSLLNLRRIREAAERLSSAAEACESFEVAQMACWHVCALAETVEGVERIRVLGRAEEFAEELLKLAPLADRETRAWFARSRLDIAELKDDHAAMERWADEVRSPFHRKLLENLRKNPQGLRIRMPFRRAIQKYDECLPTSVTSVLAAMGTPMDAEAMAAEITFGGTAEWAAAEWLEKRGVTVRFFAVEPAVATRLIKNGFAFVMTLEADANAHAVAVVGLDEAAGTLIVHDPSALRTTEYLLESIGKNETPLGPRAMALATHDKAALLDELLPKDDAEAAAARIAHHRAIILSGPPAAREVVEKLAERLPAHPVTRLLKAMQAVEDGRVGTALIEFQELMKQFPGSAFVRARLLGCCRSLGDSALMRRTLAGVVQRGILPGIQSQQSWFYPPGTYVSEYADFLRGSAETRELARTLLHGVLARESSCAQAWHVLGDLLWEERDLEGAVLGYRIAAGLAESSEHYARAYCDALANVARQEEGLEWLEKRVQRFGGSSRAIATWITWINALENWGHPERALAACEQSLKNHGDSPELLGFVVPFLARMGHWEKADALLGQLEGAGNSALYHEAAVDFYHRRGELNSAVNHAEAWVQESPLSMDARRELLRLVTKRDGTETALELAARWFEEHPGHDDLEQLYSQYLEQASAPRWKRYALLLRRVKRNPEDGGAWRGIAFNCIADYESKDEKGREKLKRRLPRLIAECERTAPEDAATMRVRAQWCEMQGKWSEAIDHWMSSIKREPYGMYSYRQVWECLARSSAEQRRELWQKLSTMLLSYPGRLDAARETIMLVARRFGVAEAEEAVATWKKLRPDDPEVTEACADLLLEQGHGRSDAQRALEMVQPAAERFPYHLGLRFSLAGAQRKLGNFKEAEEIWVEIIRRHPENSSAKIQLARVHERHGRIDEALQILASAASADPQNVDIHEVQARILIDAGRHEEARKVLDEATLKFSTSVPWRERAIHLYADCGDNAAAVRVARDGIVVHPQGAYLWFLLGRTLNEMPHFAAQGEVESCLRRSLELNEGLFVAADWLAMLHVDQRRYDEAEQVMRRIQDRLSDPSPAMGRLAWIRRAKGDKQGARVEMAALLRDMPWYGWGWSVLIDWLTEDKAWEEARGLLATVLPEVRTNIQFRRQRLMVLEKAGLPAAELDSEWNSLLQDFPEEVSLHLLRYDSLLTSKRSAEAAKVLESIRPIDPDSPFVLARLVEVLANDPGRKDQAVETLLRIMFEEAATSAWPADYAWKAVRGTKLEEVAYQRACELLRQGKRPTLGALSILASYAVQQGNTEKRSLQPYWRTWLPDRGARGVLRLQKMVDAAAWSSKDRYRAILMKQLSDAGYARLVARYWKKNKAAVEGDVDAWAETARALVVLKRNREARALLQSWRERSGVGMWAVANYVNTLTGMRTKQLAEVRSACRDALAGLPHDHCAKYLVHRQAEACALLGDEQGLLETWKQYRNYFDGKVEKPEWFDSRRRYLLADLLVLARSLQENNRKMYKKTLRGLRWNRFTEGLQFRSSNITAKPVNVRWWWVIWVLFLLLRLLFQHP